MSNFQAYNTDKTLKAHIRKAFLKSFVLTAADITKKNVRLHDRTKWKIFFDSPMMGEIILREIQEYGDAYVIGSFQLHTNGSQHVVLRKDQVAAEIAEGAGKEPKGQDLSPDSYSLPAILAGDLSSKKDKEI